MSHTQKSELPARAGLRGFHKNWVVSTVYSPSVTYSGTRNLIIKIISIWYTLQWVEVKYLGTLKIKSSLSLYKKYEMVTWSFFAPWLALLQINCHHLVILSCGLWEVVQQKLPFVMTEVKLQRITLIRLKNMITKIAEAWEQADNMVAVNCYYSRQHGGTIIHPTRLAINHCSFCG